MQKSDNLATGQFGRPARFWRSAKHWAPIPYRFLLPTVAARLLDQTPARQEPLRAPKEKQTQLPSLPRERSVEQRETNRTTPLTGKQQEQSGQEQPGSGSACALLLGGRMRIIATYSRFRPGET